MAQKLGSIKSFNEEIMSISRIFDDMLTFIDHNEDAKILQKSHDMTSFMIKSYGDMEIVNRELVVFKDDLFVQP